MSEIASFPTESDVLKAISGLFTATRSDAALAHYPTLRIQTDNLRAALISAIQSTNVIVDEWSAKLSNCGNVSDKFRSPTVPLYAYRIIAPELVRNLHRVADFLLEESKARPPVDMHRVRETIPSFSDFVKLGAAVRSFLDALVQAAYQLVTFDGRQLNYKFLQSLLSFATVAPPSLHANIMSQNMQIALDAYVALSGRGRKKSAFTEASNDQFRQRLDMACPVGFDEQRRRNIELLFNFCSDFVHSGYVSVLALGEPDSGIVTGGPGDVFTPRTENFAELKQTLLAECAGAYADLFLPGLKRAIGRTLTEETPTLWVNELDRSASQICSVRRILNQQLIEPIRQGLIGSNTALQIHCMCGGQAEVHSPHHDWDRFCPNCGSRFHLFEVPEFVDYVISASGAGDVLGNDAEKIVELDDAAKQKLKRVVAKHRPERSGSEQRFVFINDLANCDEDTLEVQACVASAPSDVLRGQCNMFAFVAAKSLDRCAVVRVRCACGSAADYCTIDHTNVCRCPHCGTVIGLFGITGSHTHIKSSKPDGTPDTVPIQARDRFSSPGTAI